MFQYEDGNLQTSPDVFQTINDLLTETHEPSPREKMKVETKLSNFRSLCERLKKQLSFETVIDYFAFDCSMLQSQKSNHIQVNLILRSYKNKKMIKVECLAKREDKLPSVIDLWPNVDWYEREISEMFGIFFDKKDHLPLLKADNIKGFPLRKNSKIEIVGEPHKKDFIFQKDDSVVFNPMVSPKSYLTIGPISDLFEAPLKFNLELEDEIVRRCHVEPGFGHRGFEKLCEDRDYKTVLPFVERLNLSNGFSYSFGHCKLVEEVLGIEIPERGKALRMVLAEFVRIVGHLRYFEKVFFRSSLAIQQGHCFKLREIINEQFEKISGSPFLLNFNILGGIRSDVTSEWIAESLKILKTVDKTVADLSMMTINNRAWCDSMKKCFVDGREAIEWGYSGPNLRASGINYDLRKASPYYFYEDLEFEVPLGMFGQNYDRFLVRLEEVSQSVRIIGQILDSLPRGEVSEKSLDNISSLKTEYQNGKINLESYLQKVKENPSLPQGSFSDSTEAPNGELQFHILSDGQETPYRYRAMGPSYVFCQSFQRFLQKIDIEDLPLTMATFDICIEEVDR